MNERISVDPQVCHGQACIKGTRIPVHQIVKMLANGDTIEDLLRAYPTLTRGDILACLEYAGALAEEQVAPIETISP
jgi:uncharacterized protein (DUF433 family)